MTKARREKNRKIAAFVGWVYDAETEVWHEPGCSRWKEEMPCVLDCCDEDGLPDFYTSEEANAMVLETMPMPSVWRNYPDDCDGSWGCRANSTASSKNAACIVSAKDRKTAICEAFLRWIEEK